MKRRTVLLLLIVILSGVNASCMPKAADASATEVPLEVMASQEASVAQPTATETLVAASESPTVESPALASPILTGDVTFCDPSLRLLNFRLVSSFSSSDFNHQVVLNGEEIKCEINPSNKSLLSCFYPESTGFPAAVRVVLDGTVVNEFEYDGADCIVYPKSEQGCSGMNGLGTAVPCP
jgi:hypothetical protein